MNRSIIITGARQHNLKDIHVSIPKNKLVILTGVSGSGKSSLAFDTLYAEGQRRYVESLSSYARQFLGMMEKPDVDHIEGLSPAISIDQKTTSHNPRSIVGTITEIYDYLRLLFARVGHPHCPECGKEIATQSVDQIIQHITDILEQRFDGTPMRFMILSPVVKQRKGEFSGLLENLRKQGYQKVRIDGQVFNINEDISLIKTNKHSIDVVIDRIVAGNDWMKQDEQARKQFQTRITASLEDALRLSDGFALVSFIQDAGLSFPEKPKDMHDVLFSEQFACSDCGISIDEIEPRLFSFNSPQGACETCNGLGTLLKIDSDTMIAPGLTLSEGAIIPFARMMSNDTWWARTVQEVVKDLSYNFRKTAWEDMDEKAHATLLHGSEKIYKVIGENRYGKETVIHEKFEGFITNLERRYEETDSDYIRKEIEKYMRKETCPACNGTRLKPEALSVHIAGNTIAEVTDLAIDKALSWTKALTNILSDKEKIIGEMVIKEIRSRLEFLVSVGLSYLTLNREAATLAGGEAQRIRLASQIGTGLSGVLYVLDEPTIGLHQKDNHRLIETLKNLREKGNTVVVVEHDKEVIENADYIIDFGPMAGKKGGDVVAQGSLQDITKNKYSLTGKYLSNKKKVTRKRITKNPEEYIDLEGATMYNLKNINVSFPLNRLVCITGLSGSGKSTLLHNTLYYNLAEQLGRSIDEKPGPLQSIKVPRKVKKVSLIDQSPIGRTPRSNPATYTKVFDYIRRIFANTQDAKVRGYKVGRFSFNVKGGRCEACQGEGKIKIEMQFLPDVYVTCDVCHGKRYNRETLEVKYKGKTIADVLDMEVDEAVAFFGSHGTLRKKLKTLQDVGLGYIELGQPAPTLSGGEAQRVKLAKELSIRSNEHTVYLLDEPTTGLHFYDIQKLLNVLHKLIEQDNTVIVIEHTMEVIRNTDWIIDLGPEGGEKGGKVVATGKPEDIMVNKNSLTGAYLQKEIQ